ELVRLRSLHLLDVAGLPSLVDGRFSWAVEPEDGEISFAGDGGEPVGLFAHRCFGAEVEVRAAVGILRRLVARTERRERLAVGETRGGLSVVERYRPEDSSRDVGRQPQVIVAVTREGRALAIGKGHQVIGALAGRNRQHAGTNRVVVGEKVDPCVECQILPSGVYPCQVQWT